MTYEEITAEQSASKLRARYEELNITRDSVRSTINTNAQNAALFATCNLERNLIRQELRKRGEALMQGVGKRRADGKTQTINLMTDDTVMEHVTNSPKLLQQLKEFISKGKVN